jgi:hypothetical protein
VRRDHVGAGYLVGDVAARGLGGPHHGATRALVNEWDPIGVADIQPDEYDGLNGLILARLGLGEDRAAFCEFMSREACNLGASAESGDAFGAVLFAWFASKRAPTGAERSSARRPQLRKGRRYRSSHWNR